MERQEERPRGRPNHEGKPKKKGGSHQKPGLAEPSAAFTEARATSIATLWDDERDRSRAGGPDEWVIPLLHTINAKRHLYTASSCAGRLIVTLNRPQGESGYAVPWLFVSHDYVDNVDAMLQVVEEALAKEKVDESTEVWFKLEPPILAVVSSGEAAATKLMNLARGSAGLKRCFVVAMRGQGLGHVLSLTDTRRVELLLYAGSKLVVNLDYVKTMVSVANRKLRESRDKMERFQLALEENIEF